VISVVSFLTLGLAAAPVADHQASQPAPAVPIAAAHEDEAAARAIELSRLLNSEQAMRSVVDRLLHQTLKQSLATNPDFQPVETRWPGITDEFIDTIAPIATAATVKRLPLLQQQTAQVYRDRLTLDEMATLLAFFRSPSGSRFLESVQSQADFRSIMDKAIASRGKAEIDGKEINSIATNAGSRAVGTMTLDDRIALVKLMATPAGQKLPQINAAVLQVASTVANQDDPEADAEIEGAVKALIQRHITADAAAADNTGKSGKRR